MRGKGYILLLFLLLTICAQAQSSLWLDIGALGGQSFLSVENSEEDSRFRKSSSIDQFGLRGGVSYGVSDFIYIKAGGGIQRRGLSFKDQQTVNLGYWDVFTTQYKVDLTNTYAQLYFGLEKPLRVDQSNTPFFGLTGVYNYLSQGTVFNTQSDLNWGNSQASFNFESTVVDKNMGLEPEFGFYMSASSKSRWKMSFMYHLGLTEQMSGDLTVRDASSTILSTSNITSDGNYFMFKLAYEGRLMKSDQDKKDERQKRKREEAKRKKEEDEQKKLEKEERKKLEEERKQKEKEEEKAEEGPKDLQVDPSGKPKKLKGRVVKEQAEFEISSTTLELFFWDSGREVDGDSISIFFDGEWVAEGVALTKEKKSITLTVDPSKKKHYLIVYANNVGDHPPNTASVSFFDGTKERIFRIHSKLNENGSVLFRYKEVK